MRTRSVISTTVRCFLTTYCRLLRKFRQGKSQRLWRFNVMLSLLVFGARTRISAVTSLLRQQDLLQLGDHRGLELEELSQLFRYGWTIDDLYIQLRFLGFR